MAGKRNKIKNEESRIVRIILLVLVLFGALVSFIPFLYMFLLSLMDTESLRLNWNIIVNAKYTIANYIELLQKTDFALYIRNSVIITVYAILVHITVNSMAAYAFAKKKFTGSTLMYTINLATMMIPGQVTLIPTFLLIKWLGLLDTYTALVLPTCGAFGTLLIYSFMKKGVPDELLEAADLDGCSELYKFFRVVLPLMKPVLISLAIFTFLNCWNSYTLPLIMCTNNKKMTLTLAIANFKTQMTQPRYGYIMAANTIAFLPPFILYLFMQKQFVEGIALSGTKM